MTLGDNLINKLVGLPWREGGKTPQEGFDCWGFFRWYNLHILKRKINEKYECSCGNIRTMVEKASQAFCQKSEWVKINIPENNCAVALSRNKRIHHVGIWFNGGCLHALQDIGVVYNDIRQLKRNGFNTVEFYKYDPTADS